MATRNMYDESTVEESTSVMRGDMVDLLVARTRGDDAVSSDEELDYDVEVVRATQSGSDAVESLPRPVVQTRTDETEVVEPLSAAQAHPDATNIVDSSPSPPHLYLVEPPVGNPSLRDDGIEVVARPARPIGRGQAVLAGKAALVLTALTVGFPYHDKPQPVAVTAPAAIDVAADYVMPTASGGVPPLAGVDVARTTGDEEVDPPTAAVHAQPVRLASSGSPAEVRRHRRHKHAR